MKKALFSAVLAGQMHIEIQGGIHNNECTGRKLRKEHGKTYC